MSYLSSLLLCHGWSFDRPWKEGVREEKERYESINQRSEVIIGEVANKNKRKTGIHPSDVFVKDGDVAVSLALYSLLST